MAWVGFGVLALVLIGGAVFVIVSVKGLRASKTDGWSPAEALIGRKLWSKKRRRGAG
jgi:hypothetical protein